MTLKIMRMLYRVIRFLAGQGTIHSGVSSLITKNYESEGKNVKKILICVLCAVMLMTIAACTPAPKNAAHVEGELSDIVKKIYENANVQPSIMTFETVVDDTNKAGMLGTNDVAFIEGLASEAAIMTIPHSMVLIRVDSNSDIEATKKLIAENVDPRKWICVGVEPDQVIVDNIGDLIFLVMSENAEAYHEGFLALAK